MRYHLESYLPIEAFKPRGGVGGMTLHGGGGGVISAVTDTISNALGTAGGESGILGGLADFDDAVATSVDGGWAGLAEQAAVIAATAVGGPLGGAAARGAFDYTHGGEDRENALRNAAEQAAVSTAGSYFGPIGAGATKAGFQYTHGGKDRENALKSGLIAAGSQMATQAAKDYFSSSDIEAPITDKSDYGYSYTPDEGSPYLNGIPPSSPSLGNTLEPKSLDARPYMSDYDPQISAFQSADSNQALQSQYEAQDVMQQARSGDIPQGTSGSVYNPARPGFFQDPLQNITNRASDALDYLQKAPEKTYDYLTKTPIKEMGSDLYKFAGDNYGKIGLGALALSSMGGRQPQPQPSPAGYYSEYGGPYTGGYGSSGGVADPYLLRNRVTASNVYNYRNPNTSRYAEGGEVKHFAFGGISNALTRFTQPIEKAIVQPVGQALPFLRDAAPYAGILAAPFITSPFAAAGVGALSSGFGRPGSGFDMKRALMGGIAAYGASTVGAGLEAAGTEPTKPLVDTIGESYAVPGTEVPASTAATKGFFRDTDAMQKGVGNLLSSDSDAAMARFGTKAGTFKSGVPIVMGISGMTAIDEANKMREEAERSAGVGRQEQEDMLARISKGRKRAEQAVRENPYMYAMGGQVDDELGGDYSAMGMDQGNLQRGLFGLGYAEGGTPRLLSGGGDGMSDSIQATINNKQPARLADGEFVIPADVVSGIGNGSSKAGAKRLYGMMDRVRKERTGSTKQAKAINPAKVMAA